MKWETFKIMVDKKLQEDLINGIIINTNPDVLYFDFDEEIKETNIKVNPLGLVISE